MCNLLDNGVKYTPAGGAVTVSVTAYELFCRIDVTDTGMGLAEEEQAKVFQRFYRAPAARDGEGVGIGLYLVRQIAAGQGGYVKVSSQRGRGVPSPCFFPGRGLPRRRESFETDRIQKECGKNLSGIVCTVEGRTDYFLFGTMEEFDMTILETRDLRKVYGAGDMEVRALDGRPSHGGKRRVCGGSGDLGVRQVHPAAHAGRLRPAHVGVCNGGWPGDFSA